MGQTGLLTFRLPNQLLNFDFLHLPHYIKPYSKPALGFNRHIYHPPILKCRFQY